MNATGLVDLELAKWQVAPNYMFVLENVTKVSPKVLNEKGFASRPDRINESELGSGNGRNLAIYYTKLK